MKRHPLALGLWEMLEQGIEAYFQQTGYTPAAIWMHPARFDELRMDVRCRHAVAVSVDAGSPPKFMGIRINLSPRVMGPCLQEHYGRMTIEL